MSRKEFLAGYELVVKACLEAGATQMYGYPITPATEILSNWIKQTTKKNKLSYLQTEDEIAAGFGVCGAVLAGKKAFTATAGPGTVLMQDALSMAEGMRLPFVAIIAQRGGPSSGTVIYSQQEVVLTTHGGNGEGLRIVYSPSTGKELYYLTREIFNKAWQYRFPGIVLTDGFLLKTKQVVSLDKNKIKNIKAQPVFNLKYYKNIRNIYTVEEELMAVLQTYKKDFDKAKKDLIKYKVLNNKQAKILVIAHGLVGAVTEEAVKQFNKEQSNLLSFFRPISLQPFPDRVLNKLAEKVDKIIVVESSLGQLANLVKQNLKFNVPIKGLYKPAVGIEVREIINFILKNK